MTKQEFLKEKKRLQDKLQTLENAYVKEHSDWNTKTVYERPKKGNVKHTRFVPYMLDTFVFGNHVTIRAGGWWLDKNNVPEKWDTLLLPQKDMVISENQDHKPHPKSLQE